MDHEWMTRIPCLLALLVALPLVGSSCDTGDDWACEGEDYRPQPPSDANACHEAYTLLVRVNECIEGFYDDEFKKGLNGRNGQLAYFYALADHASSDQIATCEDEIADYQAEADAEDCATPSTDCGPAPSPDNPCYDYFTELLEYRLRCSPESPQLSRNNH